MVPKAYDSGTALTAKKGQTPNGTATNKRSGKTAPATYYPEDCNSKNIKT